MSDAPDGNNKGESLAGFVATLAPTALIAVAYLLIFVILRKAHKRYYAPRTYLGTLREE